MQHPLQQAEPFGIWLEIIPRGPERIRRTLFHLNIYCRLRCPQATLKQVMEQVASKAAANPLLITGVFNVVHQLWGYVYSNPREAICCINS
ncbi:hypothetical protein HPB48_009071 [Haemaphysalis longicornis]|uniref:Uncharacterized protein n=1 Tax=Haemaphysalis longicornis TaxID=44386 RepID=A0A9J6FWQ2_HAELO|nr:hypothetical protein HPB48_009071 [Haemaphysalis longicornis]